MINPRRREIEEDFKAKQLATGKSKLETFICDIEIEMGHLLPHQAIIRTTYIPDCSGYV